MARILFLLGYCLITVISTSLSEDFDINDLQEAENITPEITDDVTTKLPQLDPPGSEVNANNLSYGYIDESEYVSNYWDCSTQDKKLKEKNLFELNEMLEKGEVHINETQHEAKEVILVLGNAGVGKTTLVQFLAGSSSKLISKEVEKSTEEYLIEDGIKIGSSETESFTIFPELVTDESGVTFCDTPGFSDTRSPNHAILATYLMKNYLKDFKNIKIILMVTHTSVQPGMDKEYFMNVLRNLNSFIKTNIDNYKKNILLVATKVSNNYIVTDNNGATLIPDENIINSIAEYIRRVEKSIKEKRKKIYDKDENEFLSNSLKILKELKEKDKDGNYKKINIFRRPSKPGPLSGIILLQNNKKSLQLSIKNNIGYTILNGEDIGYTLSDAAKNHLDCVLNYINDKIVKISENIFENLIKANYKNKIDNYNDIYAIGTEMKESKLKLDQLKLNLDNSDSFVDYIEVLNRFLIDNNITDVNTLENHYIEFELITSFLNKIEPFSNVNQILKPITWASKILPVRFFVTETSSWYDSLIKLYEYLSSYKVQRSVENFSNISSTIDNTFENKSIHNFFMSNLGFFMNDISSQFKDDILVNRKIQELKEIIDITLKSPVNITCNSFGKFIVSGKYVKISKINSQEIIKAFCGNQKLSAIVINAVHTVFIDEDFDDDMFRGIDILILSPKWETIGTRKINIDGKDGNSHEEFPSVDDEDDDDDVDQLKKNLLGIEYEQIHSHLSVNLSVNSTETIIKKNSATSADGLAGVPGKNGGNFFGIGKKFINGNFLTITTNGGNGGKGQNGKNGRKGRRGKSGIKWMEKVSEGMMLSEESESLDYMNKCTVVGWESGVNDINTALSQLKTNENFTAPENSRPHFYRWEPRESGLPNSMFQYMYYSDYGTRVDRFVCEGEEGDKGQNGGNGGVGGLGGYKGKIRLVELGELSQIVLKNKDGTVGSPGHGGIGGDGGDFGSTITCYRVSIGNRYNSPKNFWRCYKNEKILSSSIKGVNGLSNYSRIGIEEPITPENNFSYSSDVISYTLQLENYKNNKFLTHSTTSFKNELISKLVQVNHFDFLKLFISESSINM